jgi:hypothetical protein
MRENGRLVVLERLVLGLFVVMLGALAVRLTGGRAGWAEIVWQVCTLAFVLAVLGYLSAGGADRLARSGIGSLALVLLGLAVLANLAEWIFDIGSSGWDVATDVVLSGFILCFAAYVVVRSRERQP